MKFGNATHSTKSGAAPSNNQAQYWVPGVLLRHIHNLAENKYKNRNKHGSRHRQHEGIRIGHQPARLRMPLRAGQDMGMAQSQNLTALSPTQILPL